MAKTYPIGLDNTHNDDFKKNGGRDTSLHDGDDDAVITNANAGHRPRPPPRSSSCPTSTEPTAGWFYALSDSRQDMGRTHRPKAALASAGS